ncbi:MAG: hypothetical protein AB7G54_03165 [Methyloceanibacter sp.]
MTPGKTHLPDPKRAHGPYRPFASDPGWREAWWWLGLPVLAAVATIASYQVSPDWYRRYVLPEGYGILEVSHFIIPMLGLLIAGGLLFLPFVRARPLVFAVTLLGAFSCLYIAGEEMSWGQHLFQWTTPEYWTEVNRQNETNLHNTYAIFEKTPRAILETGIFAGGLLIPVAALFWPWLRACRVSLFLPPAALAPAALGVLFFKLVDRLQAAGRIPTLLERPSESVETFLYFFILAYLIVFARRIKELETAEGVLSR